MQCGKYHGEKIKYDDNFHEICWVAADKVLATAIEI